MHPEIHLRPTLREARGPGAACALDLDCLACGQVRQWSTVAVFRRHLLESCRMDGPHQYLAKNLRTMDWTVHWNVRRIQFQAVTKKRGRPKRSSRPCDDDDLACSICGDAHVTLTGQRKQIGSNCIDASPTVKFRGRRIVTHGCSVMQAARTGCTSIVCVKRVAKTACFRVTSISKMQNIS